MYGNVSLVSARSSFFVHSRSGIYHSVATSLTHSPRMSDAQRVAFERNRREHDCLFPGGGARTGNEKSKTSSSHRRTP